jgi:heat shock protein HslJ
MYCSGAGIARRERNLLSVLRRATRYRVTGDQLTIFAGTRALARFASRRETGGGPARAALDDRKWILDSVGGKPLPKVQEEPFIVFDAAKGSAGGNTSCNVFGGSYTASGDSIRITEVISTMRACIEDARMDIERRFLDGLRQADRFEIRGGRLVLYRGQKQLLAFAGRNKV